MQPEAILTQDELDFILGMQHNPQLNVRDSTRNLTVNGGIQIQDLLARLAASEKVTIQAQFNNQKISFPLQMVEDEFHAQRLQVGTPSIYEEGPQIRPWRLVLPRPIPLETEEGALTALWVHEVSFKGVLIEYRRKGNPPRHFSAWFSPEGCAPIAMRGRLERTTEKGMAAYHLSEKYPEDSERLRQYMLGEHRRLHPAVHTLAG